MRNKYRGQVIIEYILILTVVIAITTFITAKMVSRDPDHLGFLISHWQSILEQIGADDPHSQ